MYVEKHKIWLKSDKNIGHLTRRPANFVQLPAASVYHKNILVRQKILLHC